MFFFFSSRRRHTRFDCDWSSDVCSSDLVVSKFLQFLHSALRNTVARFEISKPDLRSPPNTIKRVRVRRSEERRVGKECSSRWAEFVEEDKESRVGAGKRYRAEARHAHRG